MQAFLSRHEKKIAGISLLAIFLGLIRSLVEPFRLQYYSTTAMSFEQVKPFLIGSIVAATGLLLMVIFLFNSRYRILLPIAVLTMLSMMVVKFSFHL